ncbi:MAG: ABC transporter ATP-binding protein [Candidatus Aminicenantes bacterium]|nr:ABC transporter ATP-binding protein [Candidatus Aminicenantes bacterium]
MIQVKHLSHSLGRKTVLRNLDFHLHENDFVLIFGPNGAGKSTLLKLLAGILAAEKGDVFIGQKNISRYSKKELATQVAYLPQFDDFNLPLLVKDILLSSRYPYQALFKGYSRRDYEMVERSVERFALQDVVGRNMQTLSGGERKKVLLASAFIQDVPIVLLDEPLNFLDPAGARQVMRMLREMHALGKTIVLVSHALEHVYSQANKMLALKNGEIRYFGEKKFSAELFQDIYQVSVKRVFAENREIIYIDE